MKILCMYEDTMHVYVEGVEDGRRTGAFT